MVTSQETKIVMHHLPQDVNSFDGNSPVLLSSCPTQTPRTYCAANTEDLETVIEHIQRNYEAAPVMAAGVSMGG